MTPAPVSLASFSRKRRILPPSTSSRPKRAVDGTDAHSTDAPPPAVLCAATKAGRSASTNVSPFITRTVSDCSCGTASRNPPAVPSGWVSTDVTISIPGNRWRFRCSMTSSARKPRHSTTRFVPNPWSQLSRCSRYGRPPIGARILGVSPSTERSLVPSPPASTATSIDARLPAALLSGCDELIHKLSGQAMLRHLFDVFARIPAEALGDHVEIARVAEIFVDRFVAELEHLSGRDLLGRQRLAVEAVLRVAAPAVGQVPAFLDRELVER